MKRVAIYIRVSTSKQDMRAPDDVAAVIQTSKILCLHPVGSTLSPQGMSAAPRMKLSIRSEDLPDRVGLDWSYSYDLVRGRMELYRDSPLGDFVQTIAQEWGSIVSYDVIPPSNLRVRCKNSNENPREWPLLIAVGHDQVNLQDSAQS
jgi:hypothetical protein